MIYFDNAATTFPKPNSVYAAVNDAMTTYCANPGRSGHKMSVKSAEQVFLCREAVASFFGIDSPERVVFTQNATMGLNYAIKGLLNPADRIIISSFEHNSVLRPALSLKRRGIGVDIARIYPGNDEQTLTSFKNLIREDTKLICCTHVSNVFGNELPIEKLAHLAKKHGILFLLDASQSAGVLPINMKKMGIDYLCAPGHKGLLGPQGTGVFIINNEMFPKIFIEGGTGTQSLNPFQPENLPERFESGTLNTPGLAGLLQGIRFTNANRGEIRQKTEELCRYIKEKLLNIDSVKLYNLSNEPVHLFSFNLNGLDCETVSAALDKNGIAVRGGFHCSPLAHESVGTKKIGTVRVSPGYYSRLSDADKFIDTVYKISKYNIK